MDINDIYESNLLKAADLKNAEHTVVIATVEIKDYDDGKKLMLTFQNRKKAFILNKTNARRIEKFYGSNTDGWLGREIVLYPDLVDMQGKTVDAIRVRAPLTRAPVVQSAPVRQVSVAGGQVVQERDGYTVSTGAHPNAPGVDLEDTF